MRAALRQAAYHGKPTTSGHDAAMQQSLRLTGHEAAIPIFCPKAL
jgi:hypothetical protein